MDVCVHCAAQAARLAQLQQQNATLRDALFAKQIELMRTEEVFWDLAQDVRLNPVHVELVDNFVSVIFPAEETNQKGVA